MSITFISVMLFFVLSVIVTPVVLTALSIVSLYGLYLLNGDKELLKRACDQWESYKKTPSGIGAGKAGGFLFNMGVGAASTAKKAKPRDIPILHLALPVLGLLLGSTGLFSKGDLIILLSLVVIVLIVRDLKVDV